MWEGITKEWKSEDKVPSVRETSHAIRSKPKYSKRTYDFLKQQEIINEALILLCMEELRTVRIKK